MNQRYNRGIALYDNNRFDLAQREFASALAEEPEAGYIHGMLALCLMYQGKLDQGLAEAQEAIRYEPQTAHHHYVLCLILNKQEKYRDAERAIDEAKKLDPYVADYHVQDAALALNQGLYPEAIDKVKYALSIDPNNERAMRIWSIATLNSGDIKAALETAEHALKLAPESAYCQALMGHLLLKKRALGQAILHFRDALRINPMLDWAREGYVEALNQRNPLYGFILGICWCAEQPPRIIGFHPYVIAGSIVVYLILAITGCILSQISKHLLTMFMRFDHIAVESLDPGEIKQSNILAVWITSSMVISAVLLFTLALKPVFMPSILFLYGMPLIFTRLFEFRDDPQGYEEYKVYAIVACSISILSIFCSFGPDTMVIHNLPANAQDLSGVLATVFIFMCLCARGFPSRPKTAPAKP